MRRALLALVLVCGACGDDPTATPPDAREGGLPSDGSPDATHDAPIDGVPRDAFMCMTDGGGKFGHTVYLAVDGVSLTHAQNCNDATTNCTSLVLSDVTVPPLLDGDPNRTQIIGDLVAQLERILSPYDVTVTTTRPASGSYIMIVLGGTCSQVTNNPICSGALTGMAQQDCGNIAANDIGLVFQIAGFSGGAYANVVMWDLGYAIGLAADQVPGDCMCQNCGGASEPCSLGTDIAVQSSCTASHDQDETREFATAFGCR